MLIFLDPLFKSIIYCRAILLDYQNITEAYFISCSAKLQLLLMRILHVAFCPSFGSTWCIVHFSGIKRGILIQPPSKPTQKCFEMSRHLQYARKWIMWNIPSLNSKISVTNSAIGQNGFSEMKYGDWSLPFFFLASLKLLTTQLKKLMNQGLRWILRSASSLSISLDSLNNIESSSYWLKDWK